MICLAEVLSIYTSHGQQQDLRVLSTSENHTTSTSGTQVEKCGLTLFDPQSPVFRNGDKYLGNCKALSAYVHDGGVWGRWGRNELGR